MPEQGTRFEDGAGVVLWGSGVEKVKDLAESVSDPKDPKDRD